MLQCSDSPAATFFLDFPLAADDDSCNLPFLILSWSDLLLMRDDKDHEDGSQRRGLVPRDLCLLEEIYLHLVLRGWGQVSRPLNNPVVMPPGLGTGALVQGGCRLYLSIQ